MVQELPDEGKVMTALQTVKESGHYFAPHPGKGTKSEGARTLLDEEHRRGPLVEIIYILCDHRHLKFFL